MWALHDVLVVCHHDVVDGLHHALAVDVGDGAHGHLHLHYDWSVKKILMSATGCDELHSTKNLEVEVDDDVHGHPHGWSVKKILMSTTGHDEPHSTKNLEVRHP
jgi:hypothetical protein